MPASLYKENQLDPGIISLAMPNAQSSVGNAVADAFLGWDKWGEEKKQREQKDTLFGLQSEGLSLANQNAKNTLELFPVQKQKAELDLSNATIDN